jgi:hypothetical protein
MHIQPFVQTWLESACPFRLLVAEGDRLANDQFFTTLQALGWDLTLAWLACPDAVAQARRTARRSRQDAVWVAGRVTKVMHLCARWASVLWRLDATQTVDCLAAQLQTHPVCRGLAERTPVKTLCP